MLHRSFGFIVQALRRDNRLRKSTKGRLFAEKIGASTSADVISDITGNRHYGELNDVQKIEQFGYNLQQTDADS